MRAAFSLTRFNLIRARALRRTLLAAVCLSITLLLVGCSGGSIYANVGIQGPTIDLGPISVRTGVNLGRRL